ncbi:rna-processing protein [Stemphylium lycopersici]|uniref:Rna-processing protein n=1 Tax=Stemphylium lycopersici TaxID=183478 RepID=A0A364MX25_STELY|nr:rna-processing protein [Stemphylium lycopersici]RAR01036.1 rna-processing protein [Stemphylium lycopersici]RAR05889.1 rna-processing protein [Stemphylium lycopersici]
MAPAPKQNSKPVFKTASPFTETKCLITPLGDHRRTHIHPSKGKKRKRSTKPDQADSTAPVQDDPPPPLPAIRNHLLIGLNSVTRHLEALASTKAPQTAIMSTEEDNDSPQPLTMVLLTHPKPSLSPAHAHLPTLVHLSTLSPPSTTATTTATSTTATTPNSTPTPATRLIPLPTSSESRLASCLSIPRVGALALLADAPGAKALEEYVARHVGVTECKWVDEAMGAEWRGLNVRCEVAGEGK